MSDTLRNVSDYLENIKDTIETKSNDILSELESDLEELDTFRGLFDDEYEARDAKDYCEEMQDIFDDAYEAQRAYDFLSAAEYAGLEDEDLEAIADELEQYRELGTVDELKDAANPAELEDLRSKVAELEEKVAAFENSRLVALNVLDGVPVEQANKLYDELRAAAEEARREAEEGAYVAGIIDHAQFGEQGIPLDLDLTDTDGE